MHLYLSAEFK